MQVNDFHDQMAYIQMARKDAIAQLAAEFYSGDNPRDIAIARQKVVDGLEMEEVDAPLSTQLQTAGGTAPQTVDLTGPVVAALQPQQQIVRLTDPNLNQPATKTVIFIRGVSARVSPEVFGTAGAAASVAFRDLRRARLQFEVNSRRKLSILMDTCLSEYGSGSGASVPATESKTSSPGVPRTRFLPSLIRLTSNRSNKITLEYYRDSAWPLATPTIDIFLHLLAFKV